jgi:hypothetical protein
VTYRARRHLEAENPRFKMKGWLDATSELGPDGFSFAVVAEGGSETIRNRVLRKALEGERDLLKRPQDTALSTANYEFGFDGMDGGLARLRLTPRRKERTLVDGWLIVAPGDADLVEVRGRLAKAPSFWTTRVEIVRRYARIAGIRVPTSVESIASVRFAGRSTFRMEYTYERINSAPVVR